MIMEENPVVSNIKSIIIKDENEFVLFKLFHEMFIKYLMQQTGMIVMKLKLNREMSK